MRPLIITAVLLFPGLCLAQGSAPRLVSLGRSPRVSLEAVAGVESAPGVMVGVSGEEVLRTSDRGTSWTSAAHLPEPDETEARPMVVSAGRRVVVLRGNQGLLSRDGGATFEELHIPLSETVSDAALVQGGEVLLAATDAGATRLRLGPREATLEGFISLEATALAAGPGLVAAGIAGRLLLSRDGGRTFNAVATFPSGESLLDLAVDGSGEVWAATGAGLMVLAGDGTVRPVLARLWSEGEVGLGRGSEGELLILERGRVRTLTYEARSRGGPVEAPRLPQGLRARSRHPLRGLLPSVRIDIVLGQGVQAFELRLVWRLPYSTGAMQVEASALERVETENLRMGGEMWLDAWEVWTTHRPALRGRCPVEPGSSELEAAVEALRARAEQAIWRSGMW